jgi:hypothetical protein
VVRKLDSPEYSAKDCARTQCASASQTQLRSRRANRITEEIYRESFRDLQSNVSLTKCSDRPEISDFRCRYQFGYVQGLGNGIVGKWPPESSIVQSNANRIASKPVKGRLLVRVD